MLPPDGIRIIPGLGTDSNIYVIDSELIVDAGSGEFFPATKKEIAGACSIKRLRTLVNTHYHFDHTGGDKKFRDWLKTELAIHKAERNFVEAGDTLAERFGKAAKTATIDRELKDGESIETENFLFKVLHTPGHTAGSICLYEPEQKILITGDTLFDGKIGRTDLPTGDYNELKYSLEKLERLSIQYLLPGHGRPKTGGINFLIKKLLVSMEPADFI